MRPSYAQPCVTGDSPRFTIKTGHPVPAFDRLHTYRTQVMFPILGTALWGTDGLILAYRSGLAGCMKRLQSALSNGVSRSRFISAQSTTTHETEHTFGRNGGNRSSQESVFDNGIRKGGRALRQLSAIALFFTSVEAAARHAVERAFSTLAQAEAMA